MWLHAVCVLSFCLQKTANKTPKPRTLSGRFPSHASPSRYAPSPPEKPYPPARVTPVRAFINALRCKFIAASKGVGFCRAGRMAFTPQPPAGGLTSHIALCVLRGKSSSFLSSPIAAHLGTSHQEVVFVCLHSLATCSGSKGFASPLRALDYLPLVADLLRQSITTE